MKTHLRPRHPFKFGHFSRANALRALGTSLFEEGLNIRGTVDAQIAGLQFSTMLSRDFPVVHGFYICQMSSQF